MYNKRFILGRDRGPSDCSARRAPALLSHAMPLRGGTHHLSVSDCVEREIPIAGSISRGTCSSTSIGTGSKAAPIERQVSLLPGTVSVLILYRKFRAAVLLLWPLRRRLHPPRRVSGCSRRRDGRCAGAACGAGCAALAAAISRRRLGCKSAGSRLPCPSVHVGTAHGGG